MLGNTGDPSDLGQKVYSEAKKRMKMRMNDLLLCGILPFSTCPNGTGKTMRSAKARGESEGLDNKWLSSSIKEYAP